MGADLSMEASNFRPRKTLVEWTSRDSIRISEDRFYHGYTVVYEGRVTPELKSLASNMGWVIPDLPPMKEDELATAMHQSLCNKNHTDFCSWFYEKDSDFDKVDDPKFKHNAHVMWLLKARKLQSLLPDFKDEQLIAVVQQIKNI